MNTDSTHPTRSLLTGVLTLAGLAAIAAVLLDTADRLTREQRALNLTVHESALLREVLPAQTFDRPPGAVVVQAQDAELLGSPEALPAYPVYRDGRPAAVALTVIATDGYVGPIRLAVGIDADGNLIGVRATEHRETPGLGDRIDRQRSAWIDQFAGARLATGNSGELQFPGGPIDQISGATVTSRSVTAAVRRALEYFAGHRGTLLAPPEITRKETNPN
jgi:electron transport complex protein RnfG